MYIQTFRILFFKPRSYLLQLCFWEKLKIIWVLVTRTGKYLSQMNLFWNQSLRTDLVSSDLSVWSGVGSDVTVEEVTDGRWCVHHVHSLHVQLEQVLGCPADQFWDNNGLKQKALSLQTSILYLPDKNQMSIKWVSNIVFKTFFMC